MSAHGMTQDPNTNRIEIQMSASEEKTLKSSEKTSVLEAAIEVFEAGVSKGKAQISLHTRGQTSLKTYPRKNLEIKILRDDSGSKQKISIGQITGKDLILTAGPEDVLATKNLIGYRLIKAAKIPALETDLAEVLINGTSQGLYLITKSPTEEILKGKAEIVFRRRYNDDVELKKAKDSVSEAEVLKYKTTLESLHHSLLTLSGEGLVNALSENLNLDHYLRWLAVNYLLSNGDYSDEVYFFGSKDPAGKIHFDILPWDMDDLFSSRMHLAQIPTFPNNRQEKKAESQMLFAFESRLDRAISKDPVLLQRYFQVVTEVVKEFSAKETIHQVFRTVETDLKPYLNDLDILNNGKFDSGKSAYVAEAILTDLQSKESQPNARLNSMRQEIALISLESPEERAQAVSSWRKFLFEVEVRILRQSSKKPEKRVNQAEPIL